jgi:hypothetical protein
LTSIDFHAKVTHRYSSISGVLVCGLTRDLLADHLHVRIAALRDDAAADEHRD